VFAVQQPDSRIHYCTRSLLEVAVQRLPLLVVVAFASHRSQSGRSKLCNKRYELVPRTNVAASRVEPSRGVVTQGSLKMEFGRVAPRVTHVTPVFSGVSLVLASPLLSCEVMK
jgi:hypothetical protein